MHVACTCVNWPVLLAEYLCSSESRVISIFGDLYFFSGLFLAQLVSCIWALWPPLSLSSDFIPFWAFGLLHMRDVAARRFQRNFHAHWWFSGRPQGVWWQQRSLHSQMGLGWRLETSPVSTLCTCHTEHWARPLHCFLEETKTVLCLS